ncbi:ABC transporter ATP-binding protein [Nakamurella leprariae]|uniref:ABC transporter ATP-binding protein n=1 Tax=Nakamurella leprariae TaxID=2803911 RepID=A0A939BZT5_9ACTN|nr:ABC transporter ATP-binding protein [Nakamurella leprariae]MBM9468505.1 ABC transporter ATP-binding protein [Nakamurella leprariae]
MTRPTSSVDPAPSRLHATSLSTGYGDRRIIDDLDVRIPDGSFTVIIGPNGCGKSTLLRSLVRLLKPTGGSVLLDGTDIAHTRSKELARQIGLLPQTSIAPEGITVIDLVSRGRHPHQSALKRWSEHDERAVQKALTRTGLADLTTRVVDELSGGQRQRVWIAMALAQDTPILLLDEPTTYLDISHQIDVLDLCTSLQREGRTLVAVLHDLNQAARYATHLIVLDQGRIIAEGAPTDVVTADLVRDVFGVGARVIPDPETNTPLIVPHAPVFPDPGAHPAPAGPSTALMEGTR